MNHIVETTPRAAQDAPNWAVRLVQDVVAWVQRREIGPRRLTGYATSNRPDATHFPRALVYDSTLGSPIYSDVSGNWLVFATTGQPASFSTLSISSGTIASGTYTPTLTNVTNLDGSTAYGAQYMRVGNVVTVSGKVDVDPTLTASTKLGISLPIASTLSAAEKCCGNAVSNTIASESAAIEGDTVNNRAQMEWISTSVANHSMFYDFTYLVT